jgi:hypothetical protein
MDYKDKVKLLLNRYFFVEISFETFKQGFKLLTKKQRKNYEGIEYN